MAQSLTERSSHLSLGSHRRELVQQRGHHACTNFGLTNYEAEMREHNQAQREEAAAATAAASLELIAAGGAPDPRADHLTREVGKGPGAMHAVETAKTTTLAAFASPAPSPSTPALSIAPTLARPSASPQAPPLTWASIGTTDVHAQAQQPQVAQLHAKPVAFGAHPSHRAPTQPHALAHVLAPQVRVRVDVSPSQHEPVHGGTKSAASASAAAGGVGLPTASGFGDEVDFGLLSALLDDNSTHNSSPAGAHTGR